MTEMHATTINDRWSLLLPEHRAARPEWATGWERERLDSMHHHIRWLVTRDLDEMSIRNGCGSLVKVWTEGEPYTPRVFDIGTEEGDLSALFASWGADVVLIEPNARVWPNVRAIFQANGLEERVRGCFVGFCGPEAAPGDGHTFMWRTTQGEWPRVADGPVIGDHGFLQLNERPDVQRTTVDVLTDQYGPPDVITMDTEGSEHEVLLGALETLRAHRPHVWVSHHPEFAHEQYGRFMADTWKLMRDAEYTGTLLAFDHELHVHWEPMEVAL